MVVISPLIEVRTTPGTPRQRRELAGDGDSVPVGQLNAGQHLAVALWRLCRESRKQSTEDRRPEIPLAPTRAISPARAVAGAEFL
jgi:hypothetical protein